NGGGPLPGPRDREAPPRLGRGSERAGRGERVFRPPAQEVPHRASGGHAGVISRTTLLAAAVAAALAPAPLSDLLALPQATAVPGVETSLPLIEGLEAAWNQRDAEAYL